MGVKGKILGSYTTEECGPYPISKGSLYPQKIAVCNICDFRSNFELDPYIRKQLNFSFEEMLDIIRAWKPKTREENSITIVIWGI